MKNNVSSQSLRLRPAGKLISSALMLGLLATVFLAAPAPSQASISVGVSVGVAPPPIPVYTQPVCPGPGYMWTPGYWAYDPTQGYYWVPGTWVMAPSPGLLWTPGYWGWGGAAFVWHAGYWGPHIGFYGGINYGFGYPGVGFVGGEWRGGAFFYNRAVFNLGPRHFDHVYFHSVPMERVVTRISYNGGRGGMEARPTREDMAAEHDRHMEATSIQRNHEFDAHNDRGHYASANHGRPGATSSPRAGEFHGSPAARTGSRAGNNHPMTPAHSNAPASRGSSYHPSGANTGHSTPTTHTEPSRGPSGHQAESRPSHSGGESHHGGKGH